VIAEPVPLLSQVSPAVSVEVSNVVMRALDRDPDKRFPSCAAFADALEAAAALQDKVAMPRDLAAYVNEVMGPEIAQQRDAVRAWLAHGDPAGADVPSGPGTMSSVSAAAMSIPGFGESRSNVSNTPPPPLPPAPQRSRGPALLGGLLLLALLGAGGFLLARSASSGRADRAAAQGPEPAAAPVAVSPPVVATPEPVASAPAASAAASGSAGPADVAPGAASAVPTSTSGHRGAPAAGPAAPRGGATGGAARGRKKKPSEDVDLRNPYR